MRQEALSAGRQVAALLTVSLREQIRSGLWLWMAVIMIATAVVIRLTPIPFWTTQVMGGAVLAANAAICAITCAWSTSYGASYRWAPQLPCNPLTAAASLLVGKLAVGCLAATVAACVQGVLFAVGSTADPPGAGSFAASAALLSAWLLAVLLPWSALARVALGRVAAPWAVLALVVVAAWPPANAGGHVALMRWVLPAIPTEGGSAFLLRPSSWLYALAHAACVTLAAAPLSNRMLRFR